jgi:hypothetical protein
MKGTKDMKGRSKGNQERIVRIGTDQNGSSRANVISSLEGDCFANCPAGRKDPF